MGDRLGQQIGNYRLVKLLGKGGFAEVYLGQHVRLASKQAAIKILYLLDVDVRKFQEEAETTEKLVHPHIVRLLDFAIEQGTPYLVLDYAPGGSLRTRHPKGSLVPLASVRAYLKELALALQYAHDKSILHRDIKPDNILIGRGGELLLSDFGIAVLTQTGRTSLSSAYDIGGTPYYMAPETYQGRPVKESDQYALAVVVYEWLCGSVPFRGENFIQLGYQHSHEPVPPLRERNPAIPPEIEAVIMKALAKEPKDRFASVQTFVQAFEQACIQARQAEQERLRQAEQAERARIAEKERMQNIVEQASSMSSQTFPPTTFPHAAIPPQGLVPHPPIVSPRTAVPLQRSTMPPPSPTARRPKHLRSRPVVIVRILLTLVVLGAVSLGIYDGAVTGHLPWGGLSNQTWHVQNAGTSANLSGIAWAGHQFVVVGDSGTILTTSDGSTWTAQSSGTSRGLYDVAWSGSQFVVVGQSGTILTSPNGRTWTAQSSGTSVNTFLSGVIWSGTQFVAIGGSPLSGTILTSPDGRTWTPQNSNVSQNLSGVGWAGLQFVAVGDSGTILTSPDGRTWTAQSSGTSANLSGIAWAGHQFVVVGLGGAILTSPDGRTWTAQTSRTSAALYGVTWAGHQFVVVGTTGTILTSPDGRIWTAQSSGTSVFFNSAASAPSEVMVVGLEGTILTSRASEFYNSAASASSEVVTADFSSTVFTSRVLK